LEYDWNEMVALLDKNKNHLWMVRYMLCQLCHWKDWPSLKSNLLTYSTWEAIYHYSFFSGNKRKETKSQCLVNRNSTFPFNVPLFIRHGQCEIPCFHFYTWQAFIANILTFVHKYDVILYLNIGKYFHSMTRT
jgi:hypothetical protein